MNSMIILACVALARCAAASGWAGAPANIALSQDGRNILDTPEVAHAKAAHLAALQQAQSRGGGYENSNDDGSYDPRWENEETWQQAAPAHNQWNAAPQNQWNAAPAHQQWNGAPAPVAETPEVAQARAAHFAAYSAAQGPSAAPQWNAAPSAGAWHGAPAQIRLSHDGSQVLETPEVAAARAAHLAAHANLGPAPAAHQDWNSGSNNQWNEGSHNQWNEAPKNQWNAAPQNQWNGAPSWQGAPAQVRLSHDGSQLLDTPEVAAARAAHLAAHAQAAHSAPAPAHNNW